MLALLIAAGFGLFIVMLLKGLEPGVDVGALRAKIGDLYAQGKLDEQTRDSLLSALGDRKRYPPAVLPAPKPKAALPAAPAAPRLSPDAARQERQSSDIKTLLISGAALFVLSAYTFVRSYWEFIPATVKFAGLASTSASIYIAGRRLRAKTPTTAETLVGLGLALIPFNFFAGNVLLFDTALRHSSAWAFGFAAMLAAVEATSAELPTFSMGLLSGAALYGAVYFGCVAAELPEALRATALAAASLLALIATWQAKQPARLRAGVVAAGNACSALVALGLAARGFYLSSPQEGWPALALLLLGAGFAVQARLFEYVFAYAAGFCFAGSLALLLHVFGVPLFKYGLFFVPAGLLATVRAWTFDRAGRKQLSGPYFHIGQLMIAASLAAMTPDLGFFVHAGFSTLMVILALATAAFAVSGALYRRAEFTYAASLAVLAALACFAWHEEAAFASAALLFSAMGCVLLLGGSAPAPKELEAQVSRPLSLTGLATLTFSLAALAGRWAEPILSGQALRSGLPVDQLQASLIVAFLCAGAYALTAALRKRAELLYPALASATLFFVFLGERLGHPLEPLGLSALAAASLTGFYLLSASGERKASRCFAVWGQLVFVTACVWSVATAGTAGLAAVGLGLLFLLPGVWLGELDLTSSALLGVYLLHWLWADRSFHASASDYGVQLVAVNCAVVIARTLLSMYRPSVDVSPFKVAAAAFSVLSMLLTLSDFSVAWTVFGLYGIIAVMVSFLHYEGRYLWVGTTLLLAAYELYISSMHVDLTEAYTAPAGLYALACGYLSRDSKDTREVLYLAGQLILYVPSFALALGETWQLHGVFVGMASLGLLVFGLDQKSDMLTRVSLAVLLANGCVQSRQFFYAVPRWAYLSAGGLTLVWLGWRFESQK